MKEEARVSGKAFALVWLLLMILTGLLIFFSLSQIPGKNLFMILFMFMQAYLVSFYFMHLRFEKLPLILSVVLGVLLTTGLLYALIIWDGTRIARLSAH